MTITKLYLDQQQYICYMLYVYVICFVRVFFIIFLSVSVGSEQFVAKYLNNISIIFVFFTFSIPLPLFASLYCSWILWLIRNPMRKKLINWAEGWRISQGHAVTGGQFVTEPTITYLSWRMANLSETCCYRRTIWYIVHNHLIELKDGESLRDILLQRDNLLQSHITYFRCRMANLVSTKASRSRVWTWRMARSLSTSRFTGSNDRRKPELFLKGVGHKIFELLFSSSSWFEPI